MPISSESLRKKIRQLRKSKVERIKDEIAQIKGFEQIDEAKKLTIAEYTLNQLNAANQKGLMKRQDYALFIENFFKKKLEQNEQAIKDSQDNKKLKEIIENLMFTSLIEFQIKLHKAELKRKVKEDKFTSKKAKVEAAQTGFLDVLSVFVKVGALFRNYSSKFSDFLKISNRIYGFGYIGGVGVSILGEIGSGIYDYITSKGETTSQKLKEVFTFSRTTNITLSTVVLGLAIAGLVTGTGGILAIPIGAAYIGMELAAIGNYVYKRNTLPKKLDKLHQQLLTPQDYDNANDKIKKLKALELEKYDAVQKKYIAEQIKTQEKIIHLYEAKKGEKGEFDELPTIIETLNKTKDVAKLSTEEKEKLNKHLNLLIKYEQLKEEKQQTHHHLMMLKQDQAYKIGKMTLGLAVASAWFVGPIFMLAFPPAIPAILVGLGVLSLTAFIGVKITDWGMARYKKYKDKIKEQSLNRNDFKNELDHIIKEDALHNLKKSIEIKSEDSLQSKSNLQETTISFSPENRPQPTFNKENKLTTMEQEDIRSKLVNALSENEPQISDVSKPSAKENAKAQSKFKDDLHAFFKNAGQEETNFLQEKSKFRP
ncbi:hypothetical protein [Legionella israelensis]|uniref:Coiled-coil protein n=1 Tax=Legionella israelensis TaxID=454 RepID=A0A0W0WG91_9GAMM|nr:hypothetical protein [Legionella israelensis]KTD31335.1 hypothetical protein Lisr_0646 [Legionella israelensis]QBS09714.1 hypothetical protein E4T55_07485 [Legionella israelensis]SCY14916.1 hypothetical protein SAMN02746069_01450 [Legionella israelensis DSM 19235]STX59243.1 Uncharacterised protein [Legionella israelensis]